MATVAKQSHIESMDNFPAEYPASYIVSDVYDYVAKVLKTRKYYFEHTLVRYATIRKIELV